MAARAAVLLLLAAVVRGQPTTQCATASLSSPPTPTSGPPSQPKAANGGMLFDVTNIGSVALTITGFSVLVRSGTNFRPAGFAPAAPLSWLALLFGRCGCG